MIFPGHTQHHSRKTRQRACRPSPLLAPRFSACVPALAVICRHPTRAVATCLTGTSTCICHLETAPPRVCSNPACLALPCDAPRPAKHPPCPHCAICPPSAPFRRARAELLESPPLCTRLRRLSQLSRSTSPLLVHRRHESLQIASSRVQPSSTSSLISLRPRSRLS